MGEAVGILLLTSVELKVYCMLYAVHKLYVLLPVLSCRFGYLVGVRLVLFSPFCSPIIFGKVTKAFPLIPCGSKMADQNVGLGSFSSPRGGEAGFWSLGSNCGVVNESSTQAKKFVELHVAFGAF